MIKYADSVWAGAGSDSVIGVGPTPDYRESQTTSREYFVMSALDEIWLPQNAIQCFDIVHCDPAGGFPNHAAMAFGRGRFFVPTYINPKFMTDGDWQVYAGLLKWARRNQDVLQNTTVLTSRVELGEPYAYAHWSGTRGIIAVRNPSNDSREFTIGLAKAGAPKELSDAVCYTQYPYRRGVMAGLDSGSSIALDLAPWELVFLEIVPRSELQEPVAIGARWYRDYKGNMRASPEGSTTVRLLLPDTGERVVNTKGPAFENPRGKVRSQETNLLPMSDWFRQCDKPWRRRPSGWTARFLFRKERLVAKPCYCLSFRERTNFRLIALVRLTDVACRWKRVPRWPTSVTLLEGRRVLGNASSLT